MRKIVLSAVAAVWMMMAGASLAQVRGQIATVSVPGIGNVTTEFGVARCFSPGGCQPINVIPTHVTITLPFVFFAIIEGDLAPAGSMNWEIRSTWHDGVVNTDRGRANFNPDTSQWCIHKSYNLRPRAGSRFELYLNGTLAGQSSVGR